MNGDEGGQSSEARRVLRALGAKLEAPNRRRVPPGRCIDAEDGLDQNHVLLSRSHPANSQRRTGCRGV